jgi:hypothetical protein
LTCTFIVSTRRVQAQGKATQRHELFALQGSGREETRRIAA